MEPVYLQKPLQVDFLDWRGTFEDCALGTDMTWSSSRKLSYCNKQKMLGKMSL